MNATNNLRFAPFIVLISALLICTVGCSESSSTAPTLPNADGAPNAPTALDAKAFRSNVDMQSATSIVVLRWADNSTSETGFHIQRKTAGSDWIQLRTVEEDETYYRDSGIQTNLLYYYRVCAFNEHGRSNYSNEVSVQLLDSAHLPRK